MSLEARVFNPQWLPNKTVVHSIIFGSSEYLGGPGDCLCLRIFTAEYGGLKTRAYGHIAAIRLAYLADLKARHLRSTHDLPPTTNAAIVVYPTGCRYNALLLKTARLAEIGT